MRTAYRSKGESFWRKERLDDRQQPEERGRKPESCRERLQKYWLAGRPEAEYLEIAPRIGPYLALLRGLAFERDNVAWADRCIDVLFRRVPSS